MNLNTSNHEDWKNLARECAQGAIYDSSERLPHSKCLPNTRVSSESGSGKSTIMHTLADELRQEGTLAGTFFFSRKHTKRSTFERVILTFAYQLGLQHHFAQEVIMKAIHDDPALLSSEKSPRDQLEKLVIEPLRAMAHIWKDKGGASLILDALDEGTSDGTHHIVSFIRLLLLLIRDDPLPIPVQNIFISSRLWSEIRSIMHDSSHQGLVRTVLLEQYDSQEDVHIYFQERFRRIYEVHELSWLVDQPWPSDDVVAMLRE
ncbi:hypothetical protein CONPUDRAFT_169884 [Coniophora puteana RWD-64-598 SS2]|uniref:Nephrocystin 3-like N-terminal domain-containing protein n=1 Tax=Coniophora puteana (strain RWD-64-598) TaxID=741705 RepID=A0A5M3M6R6_CONPW|nr:uncharacterized protein CONPUDRAFT_169884 [Coniophora puteana RWD-64-598 SS2]EIW75028.1 hypothetical protein CONPUDRAFT_169884 [Coniophora puteana RWD-64-598 SS2]